jgi:hypothetical protein
MADLMKGKSTTILCVITASGTPFSGTITNPHIMWSVDGGTTSDVVSTSTLTHDTDLVAWQFTPPVQN